MEYFANEMPPPALSEVFAKPAGEQLIADVYMPAPDRRNGAAVLFVHGGGWHAGDREAFLWHAHRLSLRGYAACTVDYRLSGTAPFPAALEDCQSAVRWLRQEASNLGVFPDRIGAFGSSAGGHLAACLGVFEEAEGAVSSRVNCVVDIHGVHDFIAHLGDGDRINENWEMFLGGPVAEKREQWIAASPALHVDACSAPMLLVHDPEDPVVPFVQSRLLANALERTSRPVRLFASPRSGHGFVYSPRDSWTQKVWPMAMAWLDRHLLGTGREQTVDDDDTRE